MHLDNPVAKTPVKCQNSIFQIADVTALRLQGRLGDLIGYWNRPQIILVNPCFGLFLGGLITIQTDMRKAMRLMEFRAFFIWRTVTVGSFALLHKITRTACCFACAHILERYQSYQIVPSHIRIISIRYNFAPLKIKNVARVRNSF